LAKCARKRDNFIKEQKKQAVRDAPDSLFYKLCMDLEQFSKGAGPAETGIVRQRMKTEMKMQPGKPSWQGNK